MKVTLLAVLAQNGWAYFQNESIQLGTMGMSLTAGRGGKNLGVVVTCMRRHVLSALREAPPPGYFII